MSRPRKADVCARLGQSKPHDVVDVCGLPDRHEGDHKGKYHGMTWADVPGKRHRSDVKSVPGRTYIKETRGNIRGN